MPDITKVEPRDDYMLYVEFEDGASGILDMKPHMWGPVFQPLFDRSFFEQVRVDKDMGTIAWPNGADLCSDVIYYEVIGRKTETQQRLEGASLLGRDVKKGPITVRDKATACLPAGAPALSIPASRAPRKKTAKRPNSKQEGRARPSSVLSDRTPKHFRLALLHQ
ncbi:MAG: DUF2442 domain-containing protein [Thermodesulfobacteriota bacterium]